MTEPSFSLPARPAHAWSNQGIRWQRVITTGPSKRIPCSTHRSGGCTRVARIQYSARSDDTAAACGDSPASRPRRHGCFGHAALCTIFPMRRCLNLSLTLRGRCTALLTLVVFVLGSIGWPGVPQKVAGAQPGTCCCGHLRGSSACGCCKRPAASSAAGKGSCCQKKKQSTSPIFTCPCGESGSPGFIVASQPKLTAESVTIPRLVETAAVSPTSSMRPPEGNRCPDTPPPRPSVG